MGDRLFPFVSTAPTRKPSLKNISKNVNCYFIKTATRLLSATNICLHTDAFNIVTVLNVGKGFNDAKLEKHCFAAIVADFLNNEFKAFLWSAGKAYFS